MISICRAMRSNVLGYLPLQVMSGRVEKERSHFFSFAPFCPSFSPFFSIKNPKMTFLMKKKEANDGEREQNNYIATVDPFFSSFDRLFDGGVSHLFINIFSFFSPKFSLLSRSATCLTLLASTRHVCRRCTGGCLDVCASARSLKPSPIQLSPQFVRVPR